MIRDSHMAESTLVIVCLYVYAWYLSSCHNYSVAPCMCFMRSVADLKTQNKCISKSNILKNQKERNQKEEPEISLCTWPTLQLLFSRQPWHSHCGAGVTGLNPDLQFFTCDGSQTS